MHSNSDFTSCLVTGAAGFIGNRLCEKLMTEKIYVKALLKKMINTNNLDKGAWNESLVFNLAHLNSNEHDMNVVHNYIQGVDTIFHLAGIAHTQNIEDHVYQVQNIEVTKSLLTVAAAENVKTFIYFSSVKAIVAEDTYGRSKLQAEKLVLEWGKKYNRNVCILRPVLVYGKGMKGNLSQMMKGIKKGWFPPLPETYNARSLVWLEDVVDAAILVNQQIQIANGKTYTLSQNKVYSSREIYDLMRKALGLRPRKIAVPYWIWKMIAFMGDGLSKIIGKNVGINSETLKKLFSSSVYYSTDIQNELGWKPRDKLFRVLSAFI